MIFSGSCYMNDIAELCKIRKHLHDDFVHGLCTLTSSPNEKDGAFPGKSGNMEPFFLRSLRDVWPHGIAGWKPIMHILRYFRDQPVCSSHHCIRFVQDDGNPLCPGGNAERNAYVSSRTEDELRFMLMEYEKGMKQALPKKKRECPADAWRRRDGVRKMFSFKEEQVCLSARADEVRANIGMFCVDCPPYGDGWSDVAGRASTNKENEKSHRRAGNQCELRRTRAYFSCVCMEILRRTPTPASRATCDEPPYLIKGR